MINVIPYPKKVVIKVGNFIMPQKVSVFVKELSWFEELKNC